MHITKKIIGRIEKIDFPDWQLRNVDAKVDTGAYTSSLHCHHIGLTENAKEVTFFLFDPSHPEFHNRKLKCPVHDIRTVRSSNGITEKRIFILANTLFIGESYPIELSLTDRSEMRYPVLLGRKFIKKKFIVDVSGKYLADQL